MTKEEFLIAWYDQLWSNIDRSFTNIWQTIALLGSTLSISYVVITNQVPAFEGSIVGLLVAYWSIFIVIDCNLWYLRNLAFITGVERQFLVDSDYGRLVPVKYKTLRPYGFIDFYAINLSLSFFAIVIFIYIYFSKVSLHSIEDLLRWKTIIFIGLTICLALAAAAYNRKRKFEYTSDILVLGQAPINKAEAIAPT